jgi:hypothetical protein
VAATTTAYPIFLSFIFFLPSVEMGDTRGKLKKITRNLAFAAAQKF